MNFTQLFSPRQLLKTFSDSSTGWEAVQNQIHALEVAQERLADDLLADRSQYAAMISDLDDGILLQCLATDLHALYVAGNTVALPPIIKQFRQTMHLIAEKHALESIEENWHGQQQRA